MIRITSQRGIVASIVIVGFLVLVALCASGYSVYKNRSAQRTRSIGQQLQSDSSPVANPNASTLPQASSTPAANPNASTSPQVSKPDPETFDPQAFYGQVQNGMELSALNNLAGKVGDCVTTGSYPPPASYPCYWTDSKYTVSVTLTANGVINKSIYPN